MVSIFIMFYQCLILDILNINMKKATPGPGTYGRGIEINSVGKY